MNDFDSENIRGDNIEDRGKGRKEVKIEAMRIHNHCRNKFVIYVVEQ